MKNILILLIFSFLLIACNAVGPSLQSTKNKSLENNSIHSPSITIPNGSIIGYEFNSFSYTPNFNSTEAAISFSVSNLPSWANFNSATGTLTSSRPLQGLYNSILVTKIMSTSTEEKTFNIFIHGDPLYKYSWHLKNTGQTAFSASAATAGEDINFEQSVIDGFTGLGVKVLVSDTGVDRVHEDLDQNLNLTTSKNYNNPSSPISDADGHGTAVSGLIAAEANNNLGSRGVASSAELSVYNFLDSSQTSAIVLDQANGNFDIFNFSYGDLSYHDQRTDADYVDQLKWGVENLRSGKGAIYVKAAGNEFYIETPSYAGASNPVFSHNASIPLDNEQPYLVLVGALGADGKKAKYSNAGSALWITAPGGSIDYGAQAPAIITTDISGCANGYSMTGNSQINSFEYGHTLNPVCNYTSTMNGTSSATPIVTGAIALILEANSNLNWRDVKHILASTARKVDASSASTPHPSMLYKSISNFNLPGHTYEQGWVTNAAGFHFHNWYGFGAIDVDAAVQMAENYNSNLAPQVVQSYTSSPDINVPDYSSTGVSDTINVSGNLITESIQIEIEVNHLSAGDLGIELTSPSGTKSILLNINNSLLLGSDANLSNVVLLSNAFYGENSNGNWQIKVIDGFNGISGRLKNWKINIYGR